MPVKEELRKLDTFSVASINRRRKALNEILETVESGRLIGEAVEALVPSITPEYAKRLDVSSVVIEQSLYNLLGHKSAGFPSLTDCRKANWILAANVEVMKAGKPAVSFDKVHWAEWVPMVLTHIRKDVNFTLGEMGHWYSFKAIGGTPATEQFDRFIMNRGGWWFAHTTMFGLSKKSYRDLPGPIAYVGMQTWAYLDPACKFAPFERTEVTGSFKKHNRDLLSDRAKDCEHDKPYSCMKCPIAREDCARSVHSGTYISRHCASCHGQGWFADNDEKETVCLDCCEQSRLARKVAALKGRK